MSNIETGGPAFPILAEQADDGWAHVGMSLRDYFAAKAMAGELASPSLSWGEGMAAQVARNAYAMADAMLEARK